MSFNNENNINQSSNLKYGFPQPMDYSHDCKETQLFAENLAPPKKTHYNNFLVSRHIHRLNLFMDYNLAESSNRNFKQVKHQLRQGAVYLKECCSLGSACLSAEEVHHYQGLLTPREAALFEYMTTHLTLKHATKNLEFLKDSDDMLSLKERERRNMPINNRHTCTKFGVDDDVYFTMGIGNHPTPSFLEEHAEHLVTINLHEMEKMDRETMKRLWCSGHLSDYMNEYPSNKIKAGETSFEYTHNGEERKKQYTVQRDDGIKFQWTVNYNEECFLGGHVAPGVAYQFILLFRFLGYNNSYVNKVYEKIEDSRISEKEREECLSLAMTTFFPGWVYPEAKIMSRLNTKQPYVKISSLTKNQDDEAWDTKCYQFFLLQSALREGEIEGIKYLLSQGISLNLRLRNSDKSLLMEAIEGLADKPDKALNVVRFLVENGADPSLKNYNGENALHQAIRCHLPHVVTFLLNQEFPLEKEPLIKLRIRPDCKGSQKGNAISQACSLTESSAEILSILLEYGADIKNEGYTYVTEAAQANNWDTVKLLLNAGANLNPDKIQWGMTPLMIAAEKGFKKVAEIFLFKGADPNIPCRIRYFSFLVGKFFYESENNGNTALHFAAQNGHHKLVKLLIEKGALPNRINCDGYTALDLGKKYPKVAALLELHTSKSLKHPRLESIDPTPSSKKIKFDPKEKYQVACVITGINSKGKPFVLLGRKRSSEGTAQNEYVFPGGMLDQEDYTLEQAALREMQEETGIKIEQKEEKATIVPRRLDAVSYRKNGQWHSTTFFLLDCGRLLNSKKPLPGDDLIELRKISIDSIVNQNKDSHLPPQYICQLDGIPIRLSNAVLINNIFHKERNQKLPNIDALVKIEENGNQLLDDAVKKNDLKVIESLLNFGVRENKEIYRLRSPFLDLMRFNNLKAINLLLQAGFDVNRSSNFSNDTPLSVAIKSLNFPLVTLFFEKMKKPTPFWVGTDALEAAVASGSKEMITLVLSKTDENINFANNYNPEIGERIRRSPLETAIKNGDISLVKWLIETVKENVNRERTPRNRNTMLQTSISNEAKEIALYLLSLQTSDLNLEGKEGKTADYFASQNKWNDMAKIIAFYKEYPSFAAWVFDKGGIKLANLKWQKDEMSKPTLYGYFVSQKDALTANKIVKGTIRKDAEGYYLRLGKVRLRQLLGDRDVANFFYEHTREGPFWHISQVDYRSILQDKIKAFTLDKTAIDKQWPYLSTLLRQNNSIKELTLDLESIPFRLYEEIAETFKSQGFIQKLECLNVPNTKEAKNLVANLTANLPLLSELSWKSTAHCESDSLELLKNVFYSRTEKKPLKSIQFSSKGYNLDFYERLINLMESTPTATDLEMLEGDPLFLKEFARVLNLFRLTETMKNSPQHFQDEIKQVSNDTNPLYLSFNSIESIDEDNNFIYTKNHLKLFIDAFFQNTTLQELQLKNFKFDKETLQTFLRALEKHPSLHALSMDGCCLEDGDFEKICQTLLKRRIPLTHLSFDSNRKITPKGIEAISLLLNQKKIRLKSLSLDFCSLKDEALAVISKSIAQDKYLKLLNIEYNDFSEHGYKILSEALKENKKITILKISMYIDKKNGAPIKKILKRNQLIELNKRLTKPNSAPSSIFERKILEKSHRL